MALPDSCLRETYATDGACYKNLDQHRRKAAMVYLKALELSESGGTDYTDDFAQLNLDTVCYEALELGSWWVEVPFLVVAAASATDAGAEVPADIQDVAEAIKCLSRYTETQLHQMLLGLECAIGLL